MADTEPTPEPQGDPAQTQDIALGLMDQAQDFMLGLLRPWNAYQLGIILALFLVSFVLSRLMGSHVHDWMRTRDG